ncbi:MAG: hypothetical protein KJ718_06410 [Nanoarchaeota archaeon]|nr:hypothetical protein [Nanoarchaeota archaeon]MBU1052150.1 hypothetical protein [Nanoarchaeota archaeon]
MNWRVFFGWIFVVLGVLGLSYGDISDTATVLTLGIGVYLLVNAEKKERKKK